MEEKLYCQAAVTLSLGAYPHRHGVTDLRSTLQTTLGAATLPRRRFLPCSRTTPLGAVITSAKFMLDTNELKEPHATLTARIASSSSRMSHFVSDLLDSQALHNLIGIADRIVNAHGGRIDVESSEARGGTSCTVHLPRQDARATG